MQRPSSVPETFAPGTPSRLEPRDPLRNVRYGSTNSQLSIYDRNHTMARKTQVILTDDIDGSDATGTVSFGIDGVAYEIDLNDDNTQQMREQLGEWASKARRVGGRRNTGTRTASSPSDAGKIREWASQRPQSPRPRPRVQGDPRGVQRLALRPRRRSR